MTSEDAALVCRTEDDSGVLGGGAFGVPTLSSVTDPPLSHTESHTVRSQQVVSMPRPVASGAACGVRMPEAVARPSAIAVALAEVIFVLCVPRGPCTLVSA